MITILTPIAKQVFQRDAENKANISISGTNTNTSEKVRITVNKVSSTVLLIDTYATVNNGEFSYSLTLPAGWYEVTAKSDTDTKNQKFGIGEVFLCTGHSFAEGIGSNYVTDERAVIQSNIEGATVNATDFTNQPIFKSIIDYKLTDSEYSRSRGVWGMMAEYLVKSLDLPVLIYHASWGGTSLKAWAESAKGLNPIGYAGYNAINDGKGYPYAKLRNIIKTLVPKTGIRAVLIMHGENDVISNQSEIEDNYKSIIKISRNDSGIEKLPFIVSLSTWHPQTEMHVINAQKNVISSTENVFLGAALTTIGIEGRINPNPPNQDLHLNHVGDEKAALLWKNEIQELIRQKRLFETSPTVKPIVVIKQGSEIVQSSDNTAQTKGIMYFVISLLALLILKVFGFKLPLWLAVAFSGLVSTGLYIQEKDK